MTIRRLVLLAVVAWAAVAAPGCGGGEDSTSSTGRPNKADTGRPSKAEFVAKANATCRLMRDIMLKEKLEFERRRAGLKPEPGLVDMVHLVYLPAMEEQVSGIEVLRTPRGEVGRIEELLDFARRAISNAATDLKIPSIAAAEPYFADSDRLYRAYGLDDCANKGRRPAAGGV